MSEHASLYRGHRFPREVIAHAVRLHLRFALSFRAVEELLAERGVQVSYATVRRWGPSSGAGTPTRSGSASRGRAGRGTWMRARHDRVPRRLAGSFVRWAAPRLTRGRTGRPARVLEHPGHCARCGSELVLRGSGPLQGDTQAAREQTTVRAGAVAPWVADLARDRVRLALARLP